MNDIKKRILYRSQYRGCRETDHLLGKFAQAEVNNLSDEQLLIFDKLLEENDNNIYDWIVGQLEAPTNYSELIVKIRKYHNL